MNRKVNRPEIWIKPIVWRMLNLKNKLSPNPLLTIEKTVFSMFNGRPQEEESDYCFKNLVRGCQLTNECQELIIGNKNTTTGYPLTHKLLMIQIIKAVSFISF